MLIYSSFMKDSSTWIFYDRLESRYNFAKVNPCSDELYEKFLGNEPRNSTLNYDCIYGNDVSNSLNSKMAGESVRIMLVECHNLHKYITHDDNGECSNKTPLNPEELIYLRALSYTEKYNEEKEGYFEEIINEWEDSGTTTVEESYLYRFNIFMKRTYFRIDDGIILPNVWNKTSFFFEKMYTSDDTSKNAPFMIYFSTNIQIFAYDLRRMKLPEMLGQTNALMIVIIICIQFISHLINNYNYEKYLFSAFLNDKKTTDFLNSKYNNKRMMKLKNIELQIESENKIISLDLKETKKFQSFYYFYCLCNNQKDEENYKLFKSFISLEKKIIETYLEDNSDFENINLNINIDNNSNKVKSINSIYDFDNEIKSDKFTFLDFYSKENIINV